jgi:hypothetical protein
VYLCISFLDPHASKTQSPGPSCLDLWVGLTTWTLVEARASTDISQEPGKLGLPSLPSPLGAPSLPLHGCVPAFPHSTRFPSCHSFLTACLFTCLGTSLQDICMPLTLSLSRERLPSPSLLLPLLCSQPSIHTLGKAICYRTFQLNGGAQARTQQRCVHSTPTDMLRTTCGAVRSKAGPERPLNML